MNQFTQKQWLEELDRFEKTLRCYGSGYIEYGRYVSSQWVREKRLKCHGCIDCGKEQK